MKYNNKEWNQESFKYKIEIVFYIKNITFIFILNLNIITFILNINVIEKISTSFKYYIHINFLIELCPPTRDGPPPYAKNVYPSGIK